MLLTKFQGNRLTGSREEDFWRIFPYMVTAVILIMWPGPFKQTFVPLSRWDATWNLTFIGLVVSKEEDVWKYWQTTDYRRQTTPTEPTHNISPPVSQRLRWANKLRCTPRPQYYIPSFKTIGPLVPEKKVFLKCFYQIRVWQPYLSCDQNLIILTFPCS